MAKQPTAQQQESGVSLREISTITPYARNSRTHSPEQVAALAGSIDEFGFVGAIVVRDGTIAKGHGTLAAVQHLVAAGKSVYPAPGRRAGAEPFPAGLIPVQDCSGWSDGQFRAYVIADNRLAESAGWDRDMLALEVSDLEAMDFDLSLLGFDPGELDGMLAGDVDEKTQDDTYTREIKIPIYEPKNEKPRVADLYDEDKTKALRADIERADIPDDVRRFLEVAADRHTVFHFARIADFYAHSGPEIQDLMERSALVIIDFNKAIENGFIHLTERLGELVDIEQAASDA